MLTHLDLFSGIGGFALAAEWAGFKTIGFVEIDKYCQTVLRKHWPDVPIVEDIRNVEEIKEVVADTSTKGLQNWGGSSLGNPGVEKPESKRCDSERGGVQELDGERKRRTSGIVPVALVTGGFPCQPFSVAGKREGKRDDRYLWPEMFTVIKEIRPTWCLIENVAGILGMAEQYCTTRVESRSIVRGEETDIFSGLYTRQEILLLRTFRRNLESVGYETLWLVVPACAVNAPHRRDRIWIVGYSISNGYKGGYTKTRGEEREGEQRGMCQSKGTSDVAESEQSTSRRGRLPRDIGDNQGGRTTTEPESLQSQDRGSCSGNIEQGGQDVADTRRRQSRKQTKQEGGQNSGRGSSKSLIADSQGNRIQSGQPIGYEASSRDWWTTEPELGRVAYGVPNRVDRLKCLGNAIVPQVAYQILKIIAELETNNASL